MGKATFGGGCFWCAEAVFRRLKGVKEIVSGYSGGYKDNPTYEEVSSGTTGYAECIQITFDPKIISYEKLLKVFFATHNPTTLNQQGADVGTQYRSVVFYHDENQKKLAEGSLKEAEKESHYKDKFVTKIEEFKKFYPAESYHQEYYEYNKNNFYCSIVIDPKIQKLLEEFSEDIKEEYKKLT